MNYEFSNPDKLMVGTRGAVGARLFLLQVREGRRLIIVKTEKQQLSAVAEWMAAAIRELCRPGHLHEDLALEPEYEPDFVAGDITVALDHDAQAIILTISSVDDEDVLNVTLTKEWAGALAIAITQLVEAGRPPCPLCHLPLDPQGHDCPRTNGNSAPIR